jgi:hypothetical protein
LALVKPVGFHISRLRGDQRGLLRIAAQGDQRLTGADFIAAFEMHRSHRFADLGGQSHRLARLDRADRLQGVAPGRELHDLGGDGDGFGILVVLARGGLVLAAGSEQGKEHCKQRNARAESDQHGGSRNLGYPRSLPVWS